MLKHSMVVSPVETVIGRPIFVTSTNLAAALFKQAHLCVETGVRTENRF